LGGVKRKHLQKFVLNPRIPNSTTDGTTNINITNKVDKNGVEALSFFLENQNIGVGFWLFYFLY
jgi:hypothetical protein